MSKLVHILFAYIFITLYSVKVSKCYAQTTSSGQSRVIDSLKNALKNAKHDTTRIKLRYEIGEAGIIYRISYWDSIAKDSKLFLEKSIAHPMTTADSTIYLRNLAGALNNIGFIYQNQGKITQGLEYFHKSLKIFEEIKDKKGIASSLNNLGAIYDYQGDVLGALEFYHKSLKIQEEINDKEGITSSLNNIGLVYDNQGDMAMALEYYHKSLKINKEIKNKPGIATSLNNIGLIYGKQDNIPMAIEYHLKSLEICNELKDMRGIATSFNNVGILYRDQGDIPKALEYFQKSLEILEKLEDKLGIANSLNNIAAVMLKNGLVESALQYASLSFKMAKELSYPKNIMRATSILKEIYKKQNRYKEALEMYELEIQMRDSINNTETKKASIRKQFQYQYEKKAAADSVKNAEEQKVKNAQLTAQQAQLKQEKTQRFALYGGLLLVVAFSGFVFNRFKITQRQKLIIEEQKHEVDAAYEQLHEKNKEVMDSIRYARRIQNSLLTTEKYIHTQINRLSEKN